MQQRTRLLVLISLFGLFALYAVYWMANAGITSDFHIYFSAAQRAIAGRSAYLPYDVGTSFVYHPAVLSALGVLTALPESVAFALWTVASIAAYAGALLLIFQYVAPQNIRYRRISALFLLGFAPFLETLFAGQINSFVILLLVLCLIADERGQFAIAGMTLGAAIVLKTSPIVFIPLLFALRRYRTVLFAVISLAVLSAIPFLQFGSGVYADFFSVISYITGGRVVLADYFNPSAVAVSYRLLSAFGLTVPEALITWVWRLIFGAIFAWLLWVAWRAKSTTLDSRRWMFAATAIIMTIASPLIWYHHNVFLLLPLALVLLTRFPVGAAIVLLIQAERTLYNFSAYAGRISPDALAVALALTAGTATLIAQLWLLAFCLRAVTRAIRDRVPE